MRRFYKSLFLILSLLKPITTAKTASRSTGSSGGGDDQESTRSKSSCRCPLECNSQSPLSSINSKYCMTHILRENEQQKTRRSPATSQQLLLRHIEPHLIDQLQELQPNDFSYRLLHEYNKMKLSDSNKHTKNTFPTWTSNLLRDTATVSCILIVAMMLFSPDSTALWNDFGQTRSHLVSLIWLPWLWMHPGRFSLVDLTFYVHVFLSRYETWLYLQEQVWPTTRKILQRAITAELWSLFWSKLWKQVGHLAANAITSQQRVYTGSNKQANYEWELPPWLSMMQVFLTKAVERGSRKMIQVAVQKHVHLSVLNAFTTIADTIQNHVLSMKI